MCMQGEAGLNIFLFLILFLIVLIGLFLTVNLAINCRERDPLRRGKHEF